MVARNDATAAAGGGNRFEWDVALSFAGAQRAYVERVAAALRAAGVRCFYDVDEQVALWGEHLAEVLPAIYAERARAVVLFISAEYAARQWTRLERRSALVRAAREQSEYVLPARFDDTQLPGILSDLVTVDLRSRSPEEFADLVVDKLSKLGLGSAVPPKRARSVAVVRGLPPRNRLHTGREAVLERVGGALETGPVAVVAVQGMGGVGKTQIALEYAHRGVASAKYGFVGWIRSESQLTLVEDLAGLAPALGVPVTADLDETVAAVRAALGAQDAWLMVFDNAPDAVALRRWLPDGPGHVLITSRDRGWRRVAEPIEVEPFTRGESIAYLQAATGNSATGTTVDALADELGDLPLALAQAAAYMDRHRLSIGGYFALYRWQAEAGRWLAEPLEDYPAGVATTWLIQHTALAAADPAALQLLRLCAFLDPDEIDLGLLLSRREQLAGDLTSALADAAGDPASIEAVIGALTKTGLVTRLDDTRLRLHRLIALVTRHQLAADRAEAAWASHAARLIHVLFPDQPWDHPHWHTVARLAAHATAAAAHAARTATAAGQAPPDEAGAVLSLLGAYLGERADYSTASAVLSRAFALTEATHGPEHPEVARTLGNLALVQKALGEHEAARASLERVLAIFEAVDGSDHPRVARTLNNLGNVQRELGDLDAALTNLQRALAIEENAYGPDHPEVARTLGNIGNVQRDLGQLDAALTNLQSALTIQETVYGHDHPDVARALANLGCVQQARGDLDAAHSSFEQALSIFVSALGAGHPDASWVQRLFDGLADP
ncbi:tetratricopeptide repeat protein [Cryptosporangium minutisporangium]|uniref:FxSxx-COOH system tetratricopeptide repeat protein n=1 Tax=Cryptosporangium minutisporangium TaxID=113569 RepID=A0ABP6SV99_9ACTN